jgi:O-antigen ligase
LETLNRFFGIGSLTHVLRLFNYFPFTEVNYHIEGRISSFCFEPPFLAIYLTTIAGWMFSYILTEKGVLKFVPTICVVLLTYFSGSRTGLLVVFFQVFIFGIMLYRDQRYKKYIRTSITAFIAVASLLMIINGEKIFKSVSEKVESLDFSSNMKTNVSNKSRFGLQYASIQVFKEHPIIGVGFGQQKNISRLHYPFWATNNNWEFKEMYKNKNDLSFPPGYNLYTRLLAETGLVGTLLFLALIYLSVKIARQTMRNSVGDKRILAMIVYISLIGLYINWLQIDAFRIYGVWLSLAILIRFSYNTKKHE